MCVCVCVQGEGLVNGDNGVAGGQLSSELDRVGFMKPAGMIYSLPPPPP